MLPIWTSDQIARYLTFDGWGGQTLRWDIQAGDTLSYDVSGLTGDGKMLARTALDVWAGVSGLRFAEVTRGAQIVFDDDESGAYAEFGWINDRIVWADVNVSQAWINAYGTDLNGYGFQTYLHEIGHVLGLAHAGDYDGSAQFRTDAIYANDSWQQSIMSYFDQEDNPHVDASFAYVGTPQIADILAVQALYGVAGDLRTGDTTYGNNAVGAGVFMQIMDLPDMAFTILDDGGVDTLDTSSHGGAQRVNLAPGSFSDVLGEIGNLTIARGTDIENFEGGRGADRVVGNASDNVINGHRGNDKLFGRAGDDTLNGGAGADLLVGDKGDDTLIGGNGHDTLKGRFGDNVLLGNGGRDRLIGANDGADRLDGGHGNDSLSGLGGADILIGGVGGDGLFGGRGNDQLYGGAGDDVLRGNRDDDALFGGTGRDIVDGGQGRDRLQGGVGADQFVFGLGFGIDTVLDFEDGTDLLDVTGAGVRSLTDLMMSQQGAHVRLDIAPGDALILSFLDADQIDAGDFLFAF